MQKNESGPLSYNIQQNELKWIKYLNMRHERIKFLDKNIGSKFLDIGVGDNLFFFFFGTKFKSNKSKNQARLHQSKMLIHRNGNNEKIKRQPT